MTPSYATFRAIQTKVARGFSLFELMVVICIVAILAGILLDRLFWYEGLAEKTAMDHTADMIKSSLWMEAANLMMAERNAEIAALAKRNPMRLLAQKPANYAGEINVDEPASITAGSWFYDAAKHQLVYAVNHRRYFTPLVAGDFMVRYGMQVQYAEMETNRGHTVTYIAGITLVPLSQYRWR